MSFNSNLNPDVVKTELDDVWDQTFNGQQHPGHATAQTEAIFRTHKIEMAAYQQEEMQGVGAWEQVAEESELPEGTPRILNKKTTSIANFKKQIHIPVEFFEDNMHSSYEKAVRNFARRAVTTRDKNAFKLFRNAATTTLTADGLTLGNDSHTTSGGTVDNLLTDALSETSLNTAMVMMYEQKALDNEIDGHVPAVLLVAPRNFKLACEITKSELRSGTANNDMNYYSQLFPGLIVYTSPFLGDAAGGDDDDWYLLSDTHSIERFIRQDTTTSLVDYIYDSKDRYVYKGRFREEVDVMSYEGIIVANVA